MTGSRPRGYLVGTPLPLYGFLWEIGWLFARRGRGTLHPMNRNLVRSGDGRLNRGVRPTFRRRPFANADTSSPRIAIRGLGAPPRANVFHDVIRLIGTTVSPPSLLLGATWDVWWNLLRDNGFRVDAKYWPRALSTTYHALFNSFVHKREHRLYARKLAEVTIEPPLFVLGFYRCGTTHLHNLLCVDDRFAFPNLFQTLFPNACLATEARGLGFFNALLPRTRAMDNMYCDAFTPQEDELALCTLTAMSPYLGWAFPRRSDHYDRYLTFRDVPEREIRRWRAAMIEFLKKLTYRYGRPLVLKSPPHTCRIKLLLEMFPNARFVHIYRNPYAVFQSTLHLFRKISPYLRLQAFEEPDLEERILQVYSSVYDTFLEQQSLVPRGRFCELAFEDLEQEPLPQLQRVYDDLDLPDFGHAEPAVSRYVKSLGSYRKNSYSPLDADLQQRIAVRWRRFFDQWGYPV